MFFFNAILFCVKIVCFVGVYLMFYIHFSNFVFYSRIFRVHILVLCWDFSFKFFQTHKQLGKSHKFFIIKLELRHAEGLQGLCKINSSNFSYFSILLCLIYKCSLIFTCLCSYVICNSSSAGCQPMASKPKQPIWMVFGPESHESLSVAEATRIYKDWLRLNLTIIIAGRQHFSFIVTVLVQWNVYLRLFGSGNSLRIDNRVQCSVCNVWCRKVILCVFQTFEENVQKLKCSHEKIPPGK